MKISIFVDGAYMFYAQRHNEWHIDYKKVYEYFSRGKELINAYYFTAVPSEPSLREHYQRFKKALINIGYTIIEKEAEVLLDEKGQKRTIVNLDVDIVLHLISTMGKYDEAILLSGDREFIPALNYLRNNGKYIICVGSKKMTSTALMNVSDKFVDINTIRGEIEKEPKKEKGKLGSFP